jgi:hypothetical protein
VRRETPADDGSIEFVADLPESEAAELARIPGVEVLEEAMPATAQQPCAADGGYLQLLPSTRHA